MRVVALAGGVGGARFLQGLVQIVEPLDLVVIANTGDDVQLHGLHVSPDLDTITYTLGGGVHPEQGWGRAGDTVTVARELSGRYGAQDWFKLGDLDIATHLIRTQVLRNGGTLTEATRRIAAAWDLPFTLLPMTDDPAETRIHTVDGRDLGFQQWWVRERALPEVARVDLSAAAAARPGPPVLAALDAAEAVVVCPSNPVVSVGPILAVAGVREALRRRPVVGVSPIVGGVALRGMADRLLPAAGADVSAVAVAGLYSDFLDAWVIDAADEGLAAKVRRVAPRVAVTDTIMRTPAVAASLAATALGLVARAA